LKLAQDQGLNQVLVFNMIPVDNEWPQGKESQFILGDVIAWEPPTLVNEHLDFFGKEPRPQIK